MHTREVHDHCAGRECICFGVYADHLDQRPKLLLTLRLASRCAFLLAVNVVLQIAVEALAITLSDSPGGAEDRLDVRDFHQLGDGALLQHLSRVI